MAGYRERMMEATRAARGEERALKRSISKLYERAAEDMARAAENASPGGLTAARAEALGHSLRERSRELWQDIGQLTKAGMMKEASRSVAVQMDFLKDIGLSAGLDLKPTLERVFGSTADEAVAHVLRGGIYGGKAPALSKRIWNNEALQSRKIEQIIAQAVAKGESAPKLARALEAYVNPNIMQPDNWNDVYPDIPFDYKVDYNAKRLAVTSIRHAAWGATIMAARDNPFADFFHWELTPAHVIHDICDAYAAHEEGLGAGNYPIDAAPLSHPWCTCLYYVDTHKTLEQIGQELRGWLDGEDNARLEEAFGRWEANARSVDMSNNRGIIQIDSRSMAGGRRQPVSYLLDDQDISEVISDIKAIGADESKFVFNRGSQTGYVDATDHIYVRGDVFPDSNSVHPRDQMSVRAALAHEYYGHRPNRGTNLPIGAWNDEFRASYRAALDTPNLSENDRRLLILDAIERAKDANIVIKPNAEMKRLLYGADYE